MLRRFGITVLVLFVLAVAGRTLAFAHEGHKHKVLGTVTMAPYQFPVSGLTAGSYTFAAKATDNTGASTLSNAATVLVNSLPTVTLIAPAAGTIFTAPASGAEGARCRAS